MSKNVAYEIIWTDSKIMNFKKLFFILLFKGHFKKSIFLSQKIKIAHKYLFLNLKSNFSINYLQKVKQILFPNEFHDFMSILSSDPR